MADQENSQPTKPGPKTAGQDRPIQVRLTPRQIEALDAWIGRQPSPVSRPEALRQLTFDSIPLPSQSSGRWGPGVLDEHIAPNFSNFRSASIPDLQGKHPEAGHWLTTLTLSSIFNGEFRGLMRPFAMNFIYRTQNAFIAYHDARDFTLSFLHASTVGQPQTRAFFSALRVWETAFLNLQITMDLANSLAKKTSGTKVFQKNDGSKECRTYTLANEIKHHGDKVVEWDGTTPLTVPVWLSNEGFVSSTTNVSFEELSEVLGDAAEMAERLKKPSEFIAHAQSRQP